MNAHGTSIHKIAISTAIVYGFLALACVNPIAENGSQMAKVKIAIGAAAGSKTIMPSSSVDATALTDWKLVGTLSGGSEATYGSWSTYSAMINDTLELEAGTYSSFTLTSSGTTASYTGSLASQEISLSKSTLSFVMTTSGGTGSIDFAASYTTADLAAVVTKTGSVAAKAGLYTLAGAEVSGFGLGAMTTSADSTATYLGYQKSGIPAGTYFLRVRFYDGNGSQLSIYYDAYCIIAGDQISYPGGVSSSIAFDTPKYHTITWNLNSGSSVADLPGYFNESESLSIGRKLTTTTVSRSGYDFAGWYTDSSLTAGPKAYLSAGSYTSDVTLYAKWCQQYLITYTNNSGGTLPSGYPTTYSDATLPLALPVPYKAMADSTNGYMFDGWYTDSGCTARVSQIPTGTTGPYTVYSGDSSKWQTVQVGYLVRQNGLAAESYTDYKANGDSGAIAVIFGFRSTGQPLGLGLVATGAVWAAGTGASTLFGIGSSDGSGAWAVIQAADPDGAESASTNYPAFYYCNTYAPSSSFTPTGYEGGWYLPSRSEAETLAAVDISTIMSIVVGLAGNISTAGYIVTGYNNITTCTECSATQYYRENIHSQSLYTVDKTTAGNEGVMAVRAF